MAKKLGYSERYQRIKTMKPNTIQYYKEVSKLFNLSSGKTHLREIRAARKSEAYKIGRTLSQAYMEFDQGVKYENELKIRDYKILTGEYLEERTQQYFENYVGALQKNGISSDIIEFLKDNPEIIKSGSLPSITEFYIPTPHSSGKKYHLNISGSEELEEALREFLNEMWGADL